MGSGGETGYLMMPRTVRHWLLVLLIAGQGLATVASGSTAETPDLFEQLLDESGLRFSPPAGFADLTPEPNPVLPYERALRHESGLLEIRYIIRPLGRISIDYSDPHNAAPEPNHLFPLLFESLINALSSSGNTPNREYPPAQAAELFNAGWAAAAVFDVNSEFSGRYRQALMIGMHKDNRADAYSVFLYNEYPQVKELIDGVLSNLSFAPEPSKAESGKTVETGG